MKVGDKVVCVDDSPCSGRCKCGAPVNIIRKDSIYVIESMFILHGKLYLILLGVPAQPKHMRGITAARFRLLDHLKEQTRKTQHASF